MRELRQNASRYLERVRAGEPIEVSVRGEVVAVMTPVERSRSTYDRLVAEGRLTPASGPFEFPQRATSSIPSDAILDELREDR